MDSRYLYSAIKTTSGEYFIKCLKNVAKIMFLYKAKKNN